MAYVLARGRSREAEAMARQLARLPFSRSSFERIAHVVGDLYGTGHADIDPVIAKPVNVKPVNVKPLQIALDTQV